MAWRSWNDTSTSSDVGYGLQMTMAAAWGSHEDQEDVQLQRWKLLTDLGETVVLIRCAVLFADKAQVVSPRRCIQYGTQM